jgi:AraC-like DNA-binding protein
MKPEFISPSTAVSYLVHHYLILKSEEPGVTFKDRYIPDGYIGIVFLLRVEQAFIYTEEKQTLPSVFFVIPRIMPLSIEITLPGDSLIVVCRASVMSSIFDIRFNKLLTKPYSEIDLFKGVAIIEKLRGIDNAEERIHFFETFLLENFQIANYNDDEVDLAYNKVMEKEGHITVGEIVQLLDINYRTFRRKFYSRVGISLKGLIRIVRVNYLWRIIIENRNVDIQSVVFMGNFHDQSHLIHDFKKIVGETPKAFFSRNLDNVKIISGL